MSPVAVIVVAVLAAVAGGWLTHLWKIKRPDRRCRVWQAAPPPDGRLRGIWQSDGDATVAEWRERRPLTDEQAVELRKVVGNLRITWGADSYSVEMDGERQELAYRILAADDQSVVVRAENRVFGRDEFVVIHFDGPNRYWLYAAGGPLREYFRRVG